MQERFEYLDIAKGIGIIMVVLHHTSGAGSVPNIFISSFHMPLFFIISGLCFNELRYASFADYFRRKTRVLLWPLIAFTLLVYFASCLCGTDFYTLDKLASGHLPMAYWFVWVLYLTELIYYGCCRMTRNFLVRCLLLAFFLFLSLLLRYKDVSFPMSNHALFAALLFYGIGAVIRPFINRLLSINILQYGGGLPLISVFVLHQGMDLSDNVIASPWFVSVPIAIFASLGVLSVSSHKIVSHEPMKSIFIWLGKNTFVILMIHMFAINLSCHYVEPLVSSHFVYKVIEQGLVWTFSVGSAWSISKYARWMLGK